MRRRIAASRPTRNSFLCAMTLCAAIWNAWLGRGFPEVLDGARMVRQARLAFAGGFFFAGGGGSGGLPQRPPVLPARPYRFAAHVVLCVGGRPPRGGARLAPRG